MRSPIIDHLKENFDIAIQAYRSRGPGFDQKLKSRNTTELFNQKNKHLFHRALGVGAKPTDRGTSPWKIPTQEEVNSMDSSKAPQFEEDQDCLEFDLLNIDSIFANSLRRIILEEVPSMAIEDVYIVTNTGVVSDEIIAQRIGLLPINAEPELFSYKYPDQPATDGNTLVFRLKVECSMTPGAKKSDPKSLSTSKTTVKASDLIWVPQGDQVTKLAQFFAARNQWGLLLPRPISILYPETIITKLVPGQKLLFEAHAVKGIGKAHAKWMPSGTSWYRFHPQIQITRPIVGEDALALANFDINHTYDVRNNEKSQPEAFVADERNYTMHRNELEDNRFKDSISIGLNEDHIIFTVESLGAISPEKLFVRSIHILRHKCQKYLDTLNSMTLRNSSSSDFITTVVDEGIMDVISDSDKTVSDSGSDSDQEDQF